MRKAITRTITETTIASAIVSFEKGKPVVKNNPPIIVAGVVAEEKALKIARKEYGSATQLTEVAAVDDLYEISVEDFLKYAKKVVAPTPEQVEEAKTEPATEA